MTLTALFIQILPSRAAIRPCGTPIQRPIVIRENSGANAIDCPAAAEVAAELRQPLTAVGNYIGIARMLLGSAEPQQIQRALESLEKAESQILRAGDIVRRLRRVLRTPGTDDE